MLAREDFFDPATGQRDPAAGTTRDPARTLAQRPPTAAATNDVADKTYALRHFLAKYRQRHSYGLMMLKESAAIAAFQVIDTRLATLEGAGKVPLSQVLWDAAITAGLNMVAGPMIAKGVTALFNSLLKTRLALAIVPKSDLGAWLNYQFKKEWENKV
jgi:hypothetical protein